MLNDRRPLPPGLKFDIWRRDGFRCRYCGKTALEESVILEVDHVVPVAAGGTDEPANLVTACRDCNRGKGDSAASVEPWIFEGWGHAVEWVLEAQQARITYELTVIAEIRTLRDLESDAWSAADLFKRVTGREATTIHDLIALAESRVDGASERIALARKERDRLLGLLAYSLIRIPIDGAEVTGAPPSASTLLRAVSDALTVEEHAIFMTAVIRMLPEGHQAAIRAWLFDDAEFLTPADERQPAVAR